MKYSKTLFFIITVISIIAVSGIAYAQEADETYKIGLLLWIGNEAFIAEMTDLGYVEGEDVTYTIPSFENVELEDFQEEYERQVQAMVDAGVDVFVTNTDTDAVNLQALVGDAPIVFARSDDPVATGAVESLVEPGGHITGIVTNSHERRLQLLTEIDPTTKKVYYLYSPLTLEAEVVLQQVQDLAEKLEVEIVAAQVTDEASQWEVLENTPEDTDWIFLTPYAYFGLEAAEELLAVSVSHKAGISWVTDIPVRGYLIGYGPNLDATAEQAAHIVDRILRGADPADLPVQTAENYLLVNLEAAEAIDLDIPVGILRQADTIVRPSYFDELEDSGSGD